MTGRTESRPWVTIGREKTVVDRNGGAVNLLSADLNPTNFFRERVVEAQDRQGLKLSENVEFYIVNLLCDFVTYRHPTDTTEGDCLALILKKALESGEQERIALFKRLADTSLYFSGYFQDYFTNKCFDVSYYMQMGSSAYGQLADIMRGRNSYESTMSEIYRDMNRNFSKAVDVIMDVSENTNPAGSPSRSTLSVYDSWLTSASVKLEKDLLSRGIIPVKTSRKANN
jgi:hypothetical protein